MDPYFRGALQKYADITYQDLHDYLARELHAWYTKFKPSSPAVVSAGDAEVCAVVQVEGIDAPQLDGTAPSQLKYAADGEYVGEVARGVRRGLPGAAPSEYIYT